MCGVRFLLPLLVAVMLGCSWCQVQAANAWDPGENGPQKVNRLDSGMDPPVKVTLYNPNPLPTKLFARCIVSHKAYVRFRDLVFPGQEDVRFTRYVPIAGQLALYSTSWRVVNNSSLKTSLACASYAEQNASAMMYQFNGTKCRVSTARMPMKNETCGNKEATAVFIRTSCPEPTAQVTLTPAPGEMNITWTTNDPCNLAVKFKIDWVNVGGSNVTEVNSDVFNYRIYGCETQTVTVTALDSFSQPYGYPTVKSKDTLPSALSDGVVSLGFRKAVISWTADDTCSSIHHYKVTYLGSEVITTDSTASVTITNQEQCHALTVTIDGLDSHGSSVVQAQISASPTTTTNCGEFTDFCYGCIGYAKHSTYSTNAEIAGTCTTYGYNLYRPADAAEVADLIAYMAAIHVPAANYARLNICVDLTYASNKWTWGGAAAVDETSSSNWAGNHPNSTIGECAILSGADGFKLKSVDCTHFQIGMCIRYISP